MVEISTEVRGTWVKARGKSISVAGYLINEGKLTAGVRVVLRRQPNNEHDPNAIAVYIGRSKIGYLPRNLAERLAPHLDAGTRHKASVTSIGKISHWDGSTYPKIKLNLTFQNMRPPNGLQELIILTRQFDGNRGVYAIYCRPERKYYVGSSATIGNRLRKHINELQSGLHVNDELSKAWNKHGPSGFQLELLEQVSSAQLEDREQYFVRKYKAHRRGYNQTMDGKGRKLIYMGSKKSVGKRKTRRSNMIVLRAVCYIIIGAIIIIWILSKPMCS